MENPVEHNDKLKKYIPKDYSVGETYVSMMKYEHREKELQIVSQSVTSSE